MKITAIKPAFHFYFVLTNKRKFGQPNFWKRKFLTFKHNLPIHACVVENRTMSSGWQTARYLSKAIAAMEINPAIPAQ